MEKADKFNDEKNNNSVIVPEIWTRHGVTEPQQVIDEINKAYDNKERLDSNIYIGTANCGNICIIVNSADGKCQDAFPVNINSNTYFKIKEEVKENHLGEPDAVHLEIVSLAIAIDYMQYIDLFNNKQNIIDERYILFNSTFINDMIVINVEGIGQLVINYDSAKEIIEKITDI